MGYTDRDGVNARFTVETTEGETVMIVEKVFTGQDTTVLIAEDGRKFKPVSDLKVEPLDAEDDSIKGKDAPANPGEAPYEQVPTDFSNAEPATVVHTADGPTLAVSSDASDEAREEVEEENEEEDSIPA